MIKRIQGIPKFFRQVKEETKKVSWSSRKEVVSAGLIVIVVAGIITFYIWVIDLAFYRLVRLFLG